MTALDTDLGARVLAAARELAPHIAARGDEIEQARRLPEDLVQALKDAGIFRMWLPSAYGGDEIDPLTMLAVEEELARADGSVAWCIIRGLAGGYLIGAQLQPEGVADIYGPDPSIVV